MKMPLNKTPEYATWVAMKQRCTDPDCNSYHRYGGRGIKICHRWVFSFLDFLQDMGQKPTPKHSIERKNNNGDYEPDNCVWATAKQQANNRRNNRVLTIDGKSQTVAQWAEEFNVGERGIVNRLERGWDAKRALTAPVWRGTMLSCNGKTQCLRSWAKELGIDESAIRWRLNNGWSQERALSVSHNLPRRKEKGV